MQSKKIKKNIEKNRNQNFKLFNYKYLLTKKKTFIKKKNQINFVKNQKQRYVLTFV
jgi:hypothetical protein